MIRIPLTDSVFDNKPKRPTKPKPVVITGLTARLTTSHFWVQRLHSTVLSAFLTHSCKMKLITKLFEGEKHRITIAFRQWRSSLHISWPAISCSCSVDIFIPFHTSCPANPLSCSVEYIVSQAFAFAFAFWGKTYMRIAHKHSEATEISQKDCSNPHNSLQLWMDFSSDIHTAVTVFFGKVNEASYAIRTC